MTSYTPQQPQHPPVGNTPTGGDFVEEKEQEKAQTKDGWGVIQHKEGMGNG